MNNGAVLVAALLLCGAGGCSPSQSGPGESKLTPDEVKLLESFGEVLRDRLALWRRTVEILAAVQDRASMDAAVKELAQAQASLREIEARQDKLGRPPPAVEAELQRGLGRRLGELKGRREREVRRILALPGGPEFFEAVGRLEKRTGP